MDGDYEMFQPMKQTASSRASASNVIAINGREAVEIKAAGSAIACVLILVCVVGLAVYVVSL